MSEYYNLPDFDPTFLTDAKIKHYVSLMQQKYISHWQQHTIRNSKKLEFYNTFKDEYTPSCYLDLTIKVNNRKELVKLRIGHHKLLIETGRYDQIPRDNRLCLRVNQTKLKMEFIYFSIVLNTVVLEMNFIKNREPNTKHNTITSYASHQKINEF